MEKQLNDKHHSLLITDLSFVCDLSNRQSVVLPQVQGGLFSLNGLFATLDVNQAKRDFFPGVGQGIGGAGVIPPVQLSLGDPLRQGSTTNNFVQSQNQLTQSVEFSGFRS